ncbi:MAG: hypothetical protein Q8R87_05445, partial [Anaerolineaceae bacterium]|nr:hypothetical protein [Anaerolineaceae bacterium]
MNSKRILIVALLITMLAVSACAQQTPVATMEPTAAPPVESADPTAAPTEAPTTGFSVTDALNRTVTFEKTPERIVLVGRALFMVADAIYLFPEAGSSIVALGATNQGTGNFIPLIDA